MTPLEVFKLIVDLENDLADFYQEIGRIDRLKAFADIFSFMADHSQRHARQIEESATAIALPVLNLDPVKELHQRLKTSLRTKIESADEEDQVLHTLADTEETVGQIYQSMAGHYRRLAENHAAVADQLEGLAEEEFGHRDYILGKENP